MLTIWIYSEFFNSLIEVLYVYFQFFILHFIFNLQKEMRNQDVTIMKQLIGLTNTLKTMNGSSPKSNLPRNSGSFSSRKSSMDSLLSVSNDSLHSAFSDAESYGSSRGLPSAAMTLPETELTESQYHGILMTNVKLWKFSQLEDNVSEFSDQEEDVWMASKCLPFPQLSGNYW